MKPLNQWTCEELLDLPICNPYRSDKTYSSILLLGDEKYGVGEGRMTIIGVSLGGPFEIAAYAVEFIEWILPASFFYSSKSTNGNLRLRSTYATASGAIHVWMASAYFRVVDAFTHTEISLVSQPIKT